MPFWFYKPHPNPTWEELAAEVRYVSKRQLKHLWPKRFLPAIQNIDDGKMFPGFIKMFSELARDGDWDGLRQDLASFFDQMPKLNPPPAVPKL